MSLLMAIGAVEPAPHAEPGWHGWPLLLIAAGCAWGLWRWCRQPAAPKHPTTQLRRRQLDDVVDRERAL